MDGHAGQSEHGIFMKGPLLVIHSSVPWPLDKGSNRRIYHLTEALGRIVPIDLFCFAESGAGADQGDRFAAFCHRLHIHSLKSPPWPTIFPKLFLRLPPLPHRWKKPGIIRALRAFAADRNYQGILFSDLFLYPAIEAAFPDADFRIMERSQIDWMELAAQVHSPDLSAARRLLNRDYLTKTARLERRAYQRLSGQIVCGPEERLFLRKHLANDTKIEVLPSGYNQRDFDCTEWPRRPTAKPTLLFCGALDHPSNRDALGFYLRDIHPRVLSAFPEANLMIIGRNAPPEVRKAAAQKGVQFLGEVPDIRPHYQSAWLQVLPRRIGGGARMKVVESLAMKTPVVTTSHGVRGFSFVHDREVLLADRPEAFAREIIRLLQNPALRSYLEERGRETVSARYTWERLGAQFDRILQQFYAQRS